MPVDPTTLTKLEELLAAIRAYEDPRRAGSEWKQVFKLLQKTELPPARAAHVVGMRDVAQLDELLGRLRNPEAAAVEPAPPAPEEPSVDTCRSAMRAFRKRLAATRLDDESKICSRNPLSKGGETRIAAINPPSEWPQSVWQALVRQGKLRYAGHGCYELAEEDPTF